MRFIGPDGKTSTTSTPARKPVTDENSFEARGTTGRVSPALVLRAQNLVSAEILSEKLLHPPRGTGAGLDEVSHAAVVEEESARPVSAGGASKRSVGPERSFDVFVDEGEPGEEEEEGDVLPEELTRPSQKGQWSVPAPYVSEKRLSSSSRTKELEPSEGSDVVEDGVQVGHTEVRSERESEEEEEEEGNEEYEESGVLVEPSARRYHQPERRHEYSDEQDELSGSDRVDYDQPESYVDDEELSGEDYDEEDELHHAGYYSQTRAGRHEEEEYYHSEEEEYSDEEEEYSDEEDEQDIRAKEPQVVDLTLDSSDEEEDEEEVHPQLYHQDEEMLHSDEEYQDEEPKEDDDQETSSWQGIESTTPFTDLSHLPSHHQSPLVAQLLDSLLDQPTQFYPLTHQPALDQGYPGDLLDPAMFHQTPYPSMLPPQQYVDPGTALLLDEVFAFEADLPNLPPEPLDDMQMDEQVVEKKVDVVDTTAGLEFLTGLLPMGEMERFKRSEREGSESREFLPNIVPERSNQDATEPVSISAPSPEGIQTDGEMVTQLGQQPHSEDSIMTTHPMDLTNDVQPSKGVEPIFKATRAEPPLSVKNEPSSPTKPSRPPPPTEQPSTTTSVPEPEPIPATQSTIPHRSPSPPPLPENWSIEGLQTPLSYFPPLSTIHPPSLRAQKSHSTVDIIGIIRHTTPITKSAHGPDFVLPLHLVDPSTGPTSGLSVLLFRPHKSALPTHAEVGAVFLATNMKVQSHQHRAQVRTGEDSGWMVFPVEGSGEVVGDMGPPVEFGEEERGMVKALQWWWRRNLEEAKAKEDGASVNGEVDGEEGTTEVNGNETEVNGSGVANGAGHVKPRMKYKARRVGKVVNLNR